MSLIEKLNQIERLDNLIRRKATGKPADLAQRMNVSERKVYYLIEQMKVMGAPIYFCAIRKSYCYEYEVAFTLGFAKSKSVHGGNNKIIENNLFTANFLQWQKRNS